MTASPPIDGQLLTASRVDHNLKALFDVPTSTSGKMRRRSCSTTPSTPGLPSIRTRQEKPLRLMRNGIDETNPDTVGMVGDFPDRYNERDNPTRPRPC